MDDRLRRVTRRAVRNVLRQKRKRVAVRHLRGMLGVVVHRFMPHVQDCVFLIVCHHRMVGYRHTACGGHPPCIATTGISMRLRFLRLHRDARVAISVVTVVIQRLVLETLGRVEPRVSQRLRLGLYEHQWRRRILMIEILERNLADAKTPPFVQLIDSVELTGFAVRVRNRRKSFDRAEHEVGIADHENVFVLLVAVRPDQPFLLHQSRAEVVIRLLVHHDVLDGFLGGPDVELEVGESVILENLAEDLTRSLVLENSAIGRARQEPEPGHRGHVVLRYAPRIAGAIERRDIPVEIAVIVGAAGHYDAFECRLPRIVIEPQLDRLADQMIRREIMLMRQQIEMNFRQAIDVFVDDRSTDQ
ncbi:hypothetical protein FEP58_02593 [Burkholderia multivorans]|nr:hypothetical protein [Burkholderia multivorans]